MASDISDCLNLDFLKFQQNIDIKYFQLIEYEVIFIARIRGNKDLFSIYI